MSRTRSRVVSAKHMMPFLAYTDACGAGHIGAVVVVGRILRTHRTHISPWCERAAAGIIEYELADFLLGLVVAAFYAPGRPVRLFCDNMGARVAVVRGPCAAAIGHMLSAAFWHVAAKFACAVLVDFVASGINAAEPPPEHAIAPRSTTASLAPPMARHPCSAA